jgi:DNA-binding CsgD family transcriptional regulator
MSRLFVIDPDLAACQALEGLVKNMKLAVICQNTIPPSSEQDAGDVYVWLGVRGDKPPQGFFKNQCIQMLKPVRAGAIFDVIRSHDLARRQPPADIRLGPFFLSTMNHELTPVSGGKTIRLTEKESQILFLLAENGAAGLSRAELMKRVWGYGESIDSHTLETHIYRLRQKIEIDPNTPALLITSEDGYVVRM